MKANFLVNLFTFLSQQNIRLTKYLEQYIFFEGLYRIVL